MRAVVQLVREASVTVAGKLVGSIGRGVVVFLGIGQHDTSKDTSYLAEKIVNLRIFPDECARMNRSLIDVGGQMLIVSQFTLFGDCRKGRRPSYSSAAAPANALVLYGDFIEHVRAHNIPVATGEFQALMEVRLINDGPVTLVLDSEKNI